MQDRGKSPALDSQAVGLHGLTGTKTGKAEIAQAMQCWFDLAENRIRPIGTLFGVANWSGILPMGRGMDWFVVGWGMIAW